MRLLRALLFNAAFFMLTGLMSVVCLPVLLLPPRCTMVLARLWARTSLLLLRRIVGLDWRLSGGEHLPAGGPALIVAKHQSAFDTLVWLLLLPDATYVLKRELLHIPLYGWFVRRARMIAVDRKAGARAMRGLIRDGQAALAAGRQIVIFPEGTRTAPGTETAYQPGVAALYARAGVPAVPVATNSGRFWGRRAILKRPGTITVAVQAPIPPGQTREAFLATLRARIEPASRTLAGLPSPVDKAGEGGPGEPSQAAP